VEEDEVELLITESIAKVSIEKNFTARFARDAEIRENFVLNLKNKKNDLPLRPLRLCGKKNSLFFCELPTAGGQGRKMVLN